MSRFISVCAPASQEEQRSIEALLEAHGVPCFIDSTHRHSGSCGSRVPQRALGTILVSEERLTEALELLAHKPPSCGAQHAGTGLVSTVRIRAFIQLLLPAWLGPTDGIGR